MSTPRPQPWLAYLSPSRLSAYAWCPAGWHQSYVLGRRDPETVDMAFGTALHAGLEAMFKREDYELEFLREWRKLRQKFPGVDSQWSQSGVQQLEAVKAMQLQGEPERRLSIIHAALRVPVIGYADLWDHEGGRIWDFKTTGRAWGPDRITREIFQPALYSLAFFEETGTIPRFEFIVLNKNDGTIQRIDATQTQRSMQETIDRAAGMYARMEALEVACTCRKHQTEAA